MKKKILIPIALMIAVMSLIFSLPTSAAVKSDWKSITTFSYSLSQFGLTDALVPFFFVPEGTFLEVEYNNGTSGSFTAESDMIAFAYYSGSQYRLDFKVNLDGSGATLHRFINSRQVMTSTPSITPDDFYNFFDKINVVSGVKWTPDDSSVFSNLKSTISHYLFGDNFENVPFGSGWVDMICTIAVVFVFALPLLIVWIILRRI